MQLMPILGMLFNIILGIFLFIVFVVTSYIYVRIISMAWHTGKIEAHKQPLMNLIKRSSNEKEQTEKR